MTLDVWGVFQLSVVNVIDDGSVASMSELKEAIMVTEEAGLVFKRTVYGTCLNVSVAVIVVG